MGTEGLEKIGPYTFRNAGKGQKITTDTLLLAEFVLPVREGERPIELGTGTGAIPIILCSKTETKKIVAVEVEPAPFKVAVENVKRNGLSHRVELINTDWRRLPSLYPEGSFDLIISNPPYIKKGSGKISPLSARAAARHELHGTLKELVATSAYLASKDGRLCYIYPIERFFELIDALKEEDFCALRIRFVHTGKKKEATLFLIEARRGKGLTIEAPLIL